MVKEIKSERLNERYYKMIHSSGLTVLLYPMKGFSSAYALFGTRYGSIDTTFRSNETEDYITVPEGVAHFLEHKLFENENGVDAFELFAKTGASANAFTSFDRTCYEFTCTDHFEESLEVLLNFVQSPYFTEKTVQKEQGIIGQEIRMLQDRPGWRVLFNLLNALYQNHPVKVDIGGTVESIAQITPELLYRCYRTFYHPNNMVLAVAGNFDYQKAIEIVEKCIKPGDEAIQADSKMPEEPREVAQKKISDKLEVAVPLFDIGFKECPLSGKELVKALAELEILVEIITGEGSRFYREAYDENLINSTFSSELFTGPNYFSVLFDGESREPDKVFEKLNSAISGFRKNGILPEEFETSKKAVYGRYVRGFNNVESVSNSLITAHFQNVDLYEVIETVAAVTFEDVVNRLADSLQEQFSALSVINPVH